jgi:hypothetical protein
MMMGGGLSLRRLLIRIPPLALTVLGVILLFLVPGAWGKGDQVGLPGWMPAVSTALFAVPAIIIGALFLRDVVRRTKGDFNVGFLQLIGTFLVGAALALEVGLIMRVDKISTYNSLRDSSGNITTTPTAFMLYTVIGVALMAGAVVMSAYLYRQAITPEDHRYDRAPNEPDVMGEMLQHQPR